MAGTQGIRRHNASPGSGCGAYQSSISGPDSGAVYLWTVPQWADIANSDATTTSHTVTGLTNRVEYSLQVRAVDKVEGAGAGPPSDPLRAMPLKPKPAVPTVLSAVAGDSQVELSWDDPAGGSPPIINYQLWQHAEHPTLTADTRTANDEFGYAVAIDGDTAVVGMPGEDSPDNSGAAFVFTRDQGTGKWSPSPVARLRASDPGTQYRFGLSVAVHEDTSNGDTIVVGAPGPADDDGGGWSQDVGQAVKVRYTYSASPPAAGPTIRIRTMQMLNSTTQRRPSSSAGVAVPTISAGR